MAADGALLEVLRPPRGADGARGARATKKPLQKQPVNGGGRGNRTRRRAAQVSARQGLGGVTPCRQLVARGHLAGDAELPLDHMLDM